MKKMLLFIVTIVTMLSFPKINFAQTINLGTAANFVLFSSVGSVTNNGISQVTGDVGSNSAATSTGFGNVNGIMQNINGATGQAASDLAAAYLQLRDAVPTFFPTSSLLGNGDTLVAGVYRLPVTAAVLSGTIILNAQGNANAKFIFQIQAAFSTNANSKVKLINGAQACNVYWKVEGLVSMAAATFMRGTVIANNAAISMNTKDTLEGRVLSTAGAVSIDGVLAYTPTGCGSAVHNGPVAPNLATAGCYVLFSGNGSVSNTGITRVTGDVATNVGLTTGYDALYVTGYLHPGPDGFTAVCNTDLLTAYNTLNNLANDIQLLYPAQFGRNLVLTPHTYVMNGATTFTDSLYLNGEGNYNSVFVIKIKGGALTTSVNSKVLLINGAQAKNVYWLVEGAVNIDANSIFNGTIVCNNGAISLLSGVTLNGRALTTNGSLSTAAVFATSPSGNCNTLPVSWLYFRGTDVRQNVLLEWGTTNEINNGFFTIEKSKDGQSFETLTTVLAAKATGTSERTYSHTDAQPYSIGYYRISQTDKDGQKNTYKTIPVRLNATLGFVESHFVKSQYVYVKTSGAVPGKGSIELYSMEGKKMGSQNVILTKEPSTFKIEQQLPKGMYLIHIQSQGEKLYTGKIMVL